MDSGMKVVAVILLIGCIFITICCIGGIAETEGTTNNQICSRCGSNSVVEIGRYNEYGVQSNTNATIVKYRCNNCTYYYSVPTTGFVI